jgi:hypothetical protein
MKKHRLSILVAAGCLIPLAAGAQGLFGYKAGGAEAPVTGGASAEGASGAAPTLEKCAKPFGTLAISEPQSHVVQALTRYSLPSPVPLLRLMVQQSNCFQVVERGVAMQNLMQERALAEGGQLQGGQNVGKGQLVAADFAMTPTVSFVENNAGGAGLGALGGLFGTAGAVVGAVAGSMKFKQAQTMITVADVRSGIQVAAAEGNVEKTDWSLSGLLGGASGGGFAAGAGSAYTNTAEGKVVAAALLDNYNNVVKSIRNQPTLVAARASEASSANAAASVTAGDGLNVGDVVLPKIAGVRLLSGPAASAKVLASLARSDEAVFVGPEQSGYIKIQAGAGEGWVDKKLMRKQ